MDKKPGKAEPVGKRKRILLVDDDKDLRGVLGIRLERAGYETLMAGDGVTAYEMARQKQPDLIILDVMLPKMDGPDVKLALEDDPATRQIPVIFLTALRQKKEEDHQGHQLGDSIVFAKPVESERLIQAIEKLTQAAAS